MEMDGYINTSELAARYRRSGRTINRWRETRGFPEPAFPSRGAENLYRVSDVLAWELENFRKPIAA